MIVGLLGFASDITKVRSTVCAISPNHTWYLIKVARSSSRKEESRQLTSLRLNALRGTQRPWHCRILIQEEQLSRHEPSYYTLWIIHLTYFTTYDAVWLTWADILECVAYSIWRHDLPVFQVLSPHIFIYAKVHFCLEI